MQIIKRLLMVFALAPVWFASQAISADSTLDDLCVDAGYTAQRYAPGTRRIASITK